MRRIALLVMVALVMATLLVMVALPALATGPGTGECAKAIAQGETGETKGSIGELIRTTCVMGK